MSGLIEEGTYYCQINPEVETYEVEAGSIVCIRFEKHQTTKTMRLISYSDRVFFQDSNGQVRVIKDNINNKYLYDLIDDDELMKEFMWVKLQAKEYGYA
jgi:hypothetical protein